MHSLVVCGNGNQPEKIRENNSKYGFSWDGLIELFIINGRCLPKGSLTMSFCFGSRRGFSINFANIWGYQYWVCHVGIIRINLCLVDTNFVEDSTYQAKWWKGMHKGLWPIVTALHLMQCWMNLVSTLCILKVDRREAKRSIFGIPTILQNVWNIWGFNFHSEFCSL